MAHHTLLMRHALPIATSSVPKSTALRAFFTAARRLAEDEDAGTSTKTNRGFRLKGREVRQALEWLDSTGEQYRRPAPGRPNYLRQQDGGGGGGARGGGRGGREPAAAAAEAEAEAEVAEEEEGGQLAAAEGEGEADDAARPSGMLAEMESSVGGEVAQSQGRPASTQRRLQGAVRKGRLPPDPRPYGLNQYYRSERVLSEELKEAIYQEWTERSTPLKGISQRYFVCVERVSAVIRMKQIERDWLKEGKQLAPFYNDAILNMLPKTPYTGERRAHVHEAINEVPVHAHTTPQIFWPTSESRRFTRFDAGRAFSEGLLPAELRIQHPQMVEALQGADSPLRKVRAEMEAAEREREGKVRRARERNVVVVPGAKADFRIERVNVEAVGPSGRGRRGVGWRYGFPHEDRKKGQVKIPTSVP